MCCQVNANKVLLFLLLVFSVGVISIGCSKAAENPNKPQDTAENDGESVSAGKACEACHEEQTRFWAYGGHSEVSCGKCHEVEGNHLETETKPLVRGNEQCIECHKLVEDSVAKKMSADEILEHHLKALEKMHVIKVNREKVKNRCIYCHDPHLG